MPTLDQVEGLLAAHKLTWAQACQRAGLVRPPRGVAAARVQAMDAEQAVAWFVQSTGVAPATFNQLSDAATAAGVARNRMRAPDVTRAVAALQGARAAAGLQPLSVERGRGPIQRAAQAAGVTAPRRRPKAWNGPAIIDGLARAIDHLQRGERLTQRTLKRIASSTRACRPTASSNATPADPTPPSKHSSAKPNGSAANAEHR
jgi:hypothetical protein